MAEKSTCIDDKNEDCEYIYTPYITKKDGTVIYARDYGINAFRIPKKKK